MTVRVAMIVGVPTSSTAAGMMSRMGRFEMLMRRWTFSTMTMASSTRMPIEKIRANRETRLSVKPQAQENTRVSSSVTSTDRPTIRAWRQPIVASTSRITETVAETRSRISERALAEAVSP